MATVSRYSYTERKRIRKSFSKSEGKPSYGATLHQLVIKAGYKGEQYK